MAERKIGQAFRSRVLEDEPDADLPAGAEESVLMNPNRQRIFEFLGFYPCYSLTQAAGALGTSGPTAQWHAAKLARARYLRSIPTGRAQLYYPTALALEPRDIAILTAVNGLGGARLLALVVAHPGLTLRQLADAAGLGIGAARLQALRLVSADLAVVVTDGRYRRLYPSETILHLERGARRKLRAFRQRLLKRLEHEKMRPTLRPTLTREQEVEVHVGERTYVLRLPTTSLLQGIGSPGGRDA